MKTLEKLPEFWYYYHYKHDPAGPVNNYAYKLTSVGYHTEEGVFEAIYWPLYVEATVYKMGKFCDVRPLDMWMEKVEKNGILLSRFTKITDPEVIVKLQEIELQMYGSLK